MKLDDIARQQAAWDARACAAQAPAAQALQRLLVLAERSDAGQAGRVASFLAATYNGDAYRFNLFELRTVDVEISDDMLSCLDALRWGKADLHRLVPDGCRRIEAVCEAWGIAPSLGTEDRR